jgi:protein-S-isoprenylcysteine O-methyltransferase Ste14
MWFGLILALPLYWLFVPFVILLVIQAFRVNKEAKTLEAAFGQSYLNYRKQTWF